MTAAHPTPTPNNDPSLTPSRGAWLAKGALVNALATFASNLRGIFTILVARLLGGPALGTYSLAWAATDLLSKIGTCGFDLTAVAEVAKHEAHGDARASRRTMELTLVISLATSAAVAVVGGAAIWMAGPALGLDVALAHAAAVLLLALPAIALYRVSTALSRGKGVMRHDVYSRGLTESLGTPLALIVVIMLGWRGRAPELAVIAGTLASGLVAFFLARRLFPGAPGRPAVPAARDLVRASSPVALYSLVNIAIMQLDVIVLGFFVGRARGVTLETIGIYAAGVQLAGGLRKVSQVFTPIFTAAVAGELARGNLRAAESTYGYLARWMLAILLPLVAVLVLSGDAILSLFGASFPQGAAWLSILAGVCALNAFVSLGEPILMIHRPAANLVNSMVALGAAVTALIVLIPLYGPAGAAVAMLVPYALLGVLRAQQVARMLTWRWPWRALTKPMLAAAIALPAAAAVRLIGTGLDVHLVAGLVYLAGYVAAWRIVGIDAGDRAIWRGLMGRSPLLSEPVSA
jgi:O-antigen/teichoic acid export membrane protein